MHFGGNKYISQAALEEYFKNLIYRALSKVKKRMKYLCHLMILDC